VFVAVLSLIIVFSIVIQTSTGVYVLLRSKSRTKNTFVLMILPSVLFLLGFLLDITSISTETAFVARRVINMGFSFTTATLLMFVAGYCDVKIPRRIVIALFAAAFILSASVWTNDLHYLFYSELYWNTHGFIPLLDRTYGPIGLASRVYAFLCILASVCILLYKFAISAANDRKKISLILIGAILGVVANLVYVVAPIVPIVNLGAFAAVTFTVLSGISIIKFDILESVYIDRADIDDFSVMLLDSSPIMVSIWDENRQLVACNKNLLEAFGLNTKEEYIGHVFKHYPETQPCGAASADAWADLFDEAFKKGVANREWVYILPGGEDFPVNSQVVKIEYNGVILIVAYERDLREEKIAAAKEQEANELMRTIFDSAPYVVGLWDEFGAIHNVNDHAKIMFGVDDPLEIGRDLYKFSPPTQPCGTPSHELAAHRFNQAKEKGYLRFDWMHTAPNGEPMPVECIYQFFMHGNRRMMVSYTMDMTEIRAMHKNERTALNLANTIIDFAPVVFTLWNEDNRIVRTGEYVKQMFGIDDPNLFSRYFSDFSPVFQPCGTTSMEKAIEVISEARSRDFHRFSWVHNKADGTLMNCEITTRTVVLGGERMLICCNRDMSDVVAAREKERETFARSKILIDFAPLIIQQWDTNYKCIDCNQLTLDFYDYKAKEDFAENLLGIFSGVYIDGVPYWDVWCSFLDNIFESGTYSADFIEKDLDGNDVYFNVVGVCIPNGGKRTVITYSADITSTKERERERQRAELAEENNQARGRFIARMSHEIRTPITAVMGISEIHIKNPNLHPSIEEAFHAIYRSGNSLKRIVDDLLDFSKIESQVIALADEKYGVASLISDCINTSYTYLDSRHVEFVVTLDENIPAYLSGDFVRIGQIINNLLSNAFKYTDEGQVDLSMRATPGYHDEQNDEYVTLTIVVRDTGLGMSKEEMDMIFGEYSRFHTHKKTIHGSGLGMNIVYNLASAMDARIELESAVNKGTNITVHIPQKTFDEGVIGKDAVDALARFDTSSAIVGKRFDFEPESMPYGRVLVVDDVDANLYVSRGLLEFYDLQIETSSSGFEAIEKVRAGNIYDIIFMDYMMPRMDGSETMRKIKDLGYTQPIVVLTANAIIGQAEAFINEGFADYLSKPIHTRELNVILNRFIRDKQTPEVLAEAAKYREDNSEKTQRLHGYQTDSELVGRLQADFLAESANAHGAILDAINSGDLKEARLLAHSLKSRAALIHETSLQNLTQSIEDMLIKGQTPQAQTMDILKLELNRVREQLAQKQPKLQTQQGNKAKALEAITAIKPMLQHRKNSSRNALGELRNIPQAAILVKQVESFDFVGALKNLDLLQEILQN